MEGLASSENETGKLSWDILQTHSGPGILLSVHQKEEGVKSNLSIDVCV